MKITKNKIIEVEEIEIQDGIYYFIDIDGVYNKYTIMQEDEGLTDYFVEQVMNSDTSYFIKYKEDYTSEEFDVPYYFQQFVLGISGQKIEKEEYDRKKEVTLKRLI